MESLYILLFWFGYCLAIIEGELRCYCNESGCVSTGYMCKSPAGQCFTAVEVRGEVTHQTHGCLDTLPPEHRASCKVGVDVVSATKAGRLPLLLCCTEHMCNYREDIDVSIILTPKYNGSFQRGNGPSSKHNSMQTHNQNAHHDDDRDLWFKAAVIAVPIAGGFILVLLVLLAVRMLRTDSNYHRRLIRIRQEHSLTKAHMYITDHFSGKGSKQHCSLFDETEKPSKFNTPAFSDSSAGNTGATFTSPCFNENSNKLFKHQQEFKSDGVSSISNSRPSSGYNTCFSSSQTCNSNVSDTSNHSCSNNGDSHSNSPPAGKPQPRSFCSSDNPSVPYLTRDINVKIDKSCQIFSQTARIDGSDRHSGQGHHYSTVASWDRMCNSGPSAAV